MAAKGDMFYAWAADAACQERGECGGAVTALLTHALRSGMVDAVLAVKRGQDIYDAVPTLITDPEDMAETAGSLHCGTLLLSKLLKRYLDGAENMRIG
ncbi:MAG TPA: coenzyme F420 hydrogenase/dehydrogenase beta subunit N-terminal domain-containing protein, partial [Methanoculleus sp.]|nr:coenzyme F420 hydrogenase/dehydrogenase beta subunit N-terminal domain-containing protein [Methanoculleus sp.]